MAQVDVQWPSENEDFDAKTDNSENEAANDEVKDETTNSESQDEEKDSEQESEPEEQTGDQTEDQSDNNDSDGQSEEDIDHKEETSDDDKSAEAEKTSNVEGDEEDMPGPEKADDSKPGVDTSNDAPIPPTVSSSSAAVTPKKTLGIPKKRSAMLRLAFEAVLVIAVVGLGLWCWSLDNDRKDLQTQVANLNVNPQVAVQKQNQILINQVGKLIQLPKNETPTIAEVSNVTQAREQSAFFDNAQNGDKVLLYVKSGEAILYRPSTNKIIKVAPLTFNNSTTQSNTSTSSTK